MEKVKVMGTNASNAQAELEALEKRRKELMAIAKKCLTVQRFEYTVEETGEKKSGVRIRGLGMKAHDFFAEQILRLVDDSPEAEANRKAVREFIVANKDKLSWRNGGEAA